MAENSDPHSHFQGKSALQHILEKKSEESGMEPHGEEPSSIPLTILEMVQLLSLSLLVLFATLQQLPLTSGELFLTFALFSFGFLIAFAGRKAWLSWSRLERLHRLLEQERYEIEHHRPQEREELKALYALKGFEGALLDQVADVLMANDERLLKVMLEEEMGLTLQKEQHPILICAGAILGALIVFVIFSIAFWLLPASYSIAVLLALAAISAGIHAKLLRNQITSAFIWNLAIAALSYSATYFATRFFLGNSS